MRQHTQAAVSASTEAAQPGDPLALPRFLGEQRGMWDSEARWPSPETMRLLHAQYAWLEEGSIGESPHALLLKSLDESQPESEA